MTIACALCVGAAPEIYLAPAIEAIAGVVDILAVNDNSGLARSDNVALLEAGPFGASGRLRVRAEPFLDFADMRNRAFAQLRALETPPDWVLFLDADEVHGPELPYIARELLPKLGSEVDRLDGYTYHFFGTFNWISDIARRMMFYRYSPELHWVNPVHEQLVGLTGKTVVLPYVYYHYGNVLPPRMLAEKHLRYFDLGNRVPRPPDADAADAEVYLGKASGVRRFRGDHPAVAQPAVARVEAANAAALAELDRAFAARRSPADAFRTRLQAVNEALRVRLRHAERPGFFAPKRTASGGLERLK